MSEFSRNFTFLHRDFEHDAARHVTVDDGIDECLVRHARGLRHFLDAVQVVELHADGDVLRRSGLLNRLIYEFRVLHFQTSSGMLRFILCIYNIHNLRIIALGMRSFSVSKDSLHTFFRNLLHIVW